MDKIMQKVFPKFNIFEYVDIGYCRARVMTITYDYRYDVFNYSVSIRTSNRCPPGAKALEYKIISMREIEIKPWINEQENRETTIK